MAKIDKLLKLISKKNIAETLSDDRRSEIARDCIRGMKIDEKTRERWLAINIMARDIINQEEKSSNDDMYEGQNKVFYQLLTPAILQLAARMSTHIVRNNRTVECAVLGQDKQIPDPDEVLQIQQIQQSPQYQQAQQQAQQTGQQLPPLPQPSMIWQKKDRGSRLTSFMNYEKLIKSNTWLSDDHKLNAIVAGWGTGYKRKYYDFTTKENCTEILHPENVIINHDVSSLKDAPRVTIKYCLTKNDIIANIRTGYFCDVDVETLSTKNPADSQRQNDFEEDQPAYDFICQTCYLDLDEDGYSEPYRCYVHTTSDTLFCIEPAFEIKDIEVVDDKDSDHYGEIQCIHRRLDIVDRHCIDDPDGKYHSLGLNYLLAQKNKSITSILRQLMDAGLLSNAAKVSGFVTKAFKTRERDLKFRLGEFQVVDCDPMVNPQQQVIPMPMGEPSQVLLSLLQLLIESGKTDGFMQDILTGDVEMQNVPATTTLAMVEQSTRAFKPIITKLYISLKSEFQLDFHLYAKHLDKAVYAKFQDKISKVEQTDFNEEDTDIAPVADPSLSSEAHSFAKLRALTEGVQVFGPVTDMKEAALRYYTDMQFETPAKLIQQQQAPDHKAMKIQLDAKIADQKNQLDQSLMQLNAAKVENEKMKTQIELMQAHVMANEAGATIAKSHADAHKDIENIKIQKKHADIAQQQVDLAKNQLEFDKTQPKKGTKE